MNDDDKDKQTAQVIINNYIASAGDTAKCPHCGEVFTNEMLRDDKRVPTHDYPKPCRSVCPGAGQFPIPDETLLVDAIATALAAARREMWEQAVAVIHETPREDGLTGDIGAAVRQDRLNLLRALEAEALKPCK